MASLQLKNVYKIYPNGFNAVNQIHLVLLEDYTYFP